MKTKVICLGLSLLMVLTGCGKSPAVREQTEVPAITESASKPETTEVSPSRGEMTPEDILSGTGSFYSVNLGKDVTLPLFCESLLEEYTLIVTAWAPVDLDRDGTEEAVLTLNTRPDVTMGSLILHRSYDGWMGYLRYHRQMEGIKADGSFSWAGSASYHGFSRVTGFNDEEILSEDITWVEKTDGLVSYYVEGEKADQAGYDAAMNAQEEKPGLNWTVLRKAEPDAAMQKEIGALLSAAEEKDRRLQEKEETILGQQDMNVLFLEKYKNWDDCLNEIWEVLLRFLPEAEMQELTKQERDWIREKEAAMEETGKKYEGGSMRPQAVSAVGADWTKDRVYFLADAYGAGNAEPLLTDASDVKERTLAAIEAAETACQELETERNENQNMSQADLNGISQLQYEAWDKAMNTVWGILKETLSAEEMEKLTREQLQWIGEKEAAAEKAVVDAGGSSMAISAYGETAERWTRERLEILVPMITGEKITLVP